MSDKKLIIKRSGYPAKAEFVVGTVIRVLDFGAFVSLDEYENKEGLVHISEIAPGWIKDIRDHVKKGQKVVCKVLDTNPKRGHIDLSVKDVNDRQRREKMLQWKNEVKAFKWLEIAGEKVNMGIDELVEVGKKIMDKYDSVYAAFEDCALDGVENLSFVGDDLAKAIYEVAQENIKPSAVKIRGYFELKSTAPDGVEKIKKALNEAYKAVSDDGKLKIGYIGAPKYRIDIEASDYKQAEGVMKKAVNNTLRSIKKSGGEGNFIREST
ncbi:MAG: translation initiation factor IF-2 subunit alpha [Archaeoglobaceae archaeon]